MNIVYAQIADCFDLVPFITERTERSGFLEAALQTALIDASRLFEIETFVGENYYAATDGIPYDKVFYPNGTQFMRLIPYTQIISVKDFDNALVDADLYTLDNFTLRWKTYYTSKCFIGWYNTITINAKWGFPCIPDTVRLAVKYYACLMFLTNPLSRKGIDVDFSEQQEVRIRNSYNRILNEWQTTNSHRILGVA